MRYDVGDSFLCVDIPLPSSIHIFAYGSNMCLPRIQARVPSAKSVTTAFLAQRRLVFHKRGRDGSGKADIVRTGSETDRVWGVVFSLNRSEQPILDDCESGYDVQEVVVAGQSGLMSAVTYVARAEMIDRSLKPFSWYHSYVVQGATQHALPAEYVRRLQQFASITDPDDHRHHSNSQILKTA